MPDILGDPLAIPVLQGNVAALVLREVRSTGTWLGQTSARVYIQIDNGDVLGAVRTLSGAGLTIMGSAALGKGFGGPRGKLGKAGIVEEGGRSYAFRELSLEDRLAYDAGQDLSPKGVGGTVADQVRGKPTRYISAGETEGSVAKYSSGNGLAKIDIQAAIDAGAGFVCHNNVCASVAQQFGRGSQHYQNAANALEVMFKNSIPRRSIVSVK